MESVVAGGADVFRERAGASSRDLHEVRITGNLVERRQEALRFGQEPVVHVRFELTQGVVDPKAVVFYAPFEQDEVALLPRKTFEDLRELVGGGINRVIECRFMNFGVPLVPERLLAEICNFLLDIQVRDREVFQFGGKIENLLAHGRADFKRLRIRVLLKLADFKRGLALITDLDLYEFGRTAFEHAAIGNGGGARGRVARPNGNKRGCEQKKNQPSELVPGARHRKIGLRKSEMREGARRLFVSRDGGGTESRAPLMRAVPLASRARN